MNIAMNRQYSVMNVSISTLVAEFDTTVTTIRLLPLGGQREHPRLDQMQLSLRRCARPGRGGSPSSALRAPAAAGCAVHYRQGRAPQLRRPV
jgi:hypothetical protein